MELYQERLLGKFVSQYRMMDSLNRAMRYHNVGSFNSELDFTKYIQRKIRELNEI